MDTNLPPLLTAKETAKLLRTSYGGLAIMRYRRQHGPKFIRSGSKILYRASDIQAWLVENTDSGTGPKKSKPVAKKMARP